MNDLLTEKSAAKPTQSFWRKYGLRLLALGIALPCLLVALVIHNKAQDSLIQAKNAYQRQQSINSDASQSEAKLNKYLAAYRALQERGVIDRPRRLQWLETLQSSANNILIPKLDFVLSPSAPATATNTSYMNDTLAIKISPMRLDFVLMHEGDFFHLLQDMKAQSKGLFSVENCEIARGGESSGDLQASALKPNFKGHCDLIWYSLPDITQAWEVPNAPH